MTLTSTQLRVIKSILALRNLTKQNGMRTTRTQNQILEQLSAEDLAVVAEALADPAIDLSELSVDSDQLSIQDFKNSVSVK